MPSGEPIVGAAAADAASVGAALEPGLVPPLLEFAAPVVVTVALVVLVPVVAAVPVLAAVPLGVLGSPPPPQAVKMVLPAIAVTQPRN